MHIDNIIAGEFGPAPANESGAAAAPTPEEKEVPVLRYQARSIVAVWLNVSFLKIKCTEKKGVCSMSFDNPAKGGGTLHFTSVSWWNLLRQVLAHLVKIDVVKVEKVPQALLKGQITCEKAQVEDEEPKS